MKKSFIISVVLVALVAGFNACKDDKSSENRIASFMVGNLSFQINHEQNEITQIFPKTFAGTWTGMPANGKAVPVIILMDEKAEISPKGQEVNFMIIGNSSEVANYTVTAEDGSQRIYKVKITVTSDW